MSHFAIAARALLLLTAAVGISAAGSHSPSVPRPRAASLAAGRTPPSGLAKTPPRSPSAALSPTAVSGQRGGVRGG
eukprot:CAMPEP_0180124850 /NCGR_PEP_ID=MMETSP0986-20121125/4871_1 /TAXON_ID=697907 /ORGANISM="non described non described, Strain CCMP2293" /LENGTH=75 /DNA_ID=CAMNT_0022064217 /DNA_START=160 /DNA_END=383 /DNA_ORIENTATION=+